MGTRDNRELVKGPPRRVDSRATAEDQLREELRALRDAFKDFRDQVAGVRRAQVRYFRARRANRAGDHQALLHSAQLRESALDRKLEGWEPGCLQDRKSGALFD